MPYCFQSSFVKALTLATVVFLLTLTACGGGANSPNSAASLSGNWQMQLVRNPTFSRSQSGFIVQSGKMLNGGLTLSQNLLGNCAAAGPAQGQMSGSKVAISVNETGQTVNLAGTVATDGSSMSGNYSILANGCGLSEVGTWTGTKVKAVSGSFQATLSSSWRPNLVYQFTGTVTQGANTGAPNATLSGSMTSTNSPCFSNASLSGLISGTTLVLNPFAADGTALGQISGTVTTDGSTITGNYNFFNVNSTVFANCGGGDSGTISVTVQ